MGGTYPTIRRCGTCGVEVSRWSQYGEIWFAAPCGHALPTSADPPIGDLPATMTEPTDFDDSVPEELMIGDRDGESADSEAAFAQVSALDPESADPEQFYRRKVRERYIARGRELGYQAAIDRLRWLATGRRGPLATALDQAADVLEAGEDFLVPDEPVAEVQAAFEAGEKRVTHPPIEPDPSVPDGGPEHIGGWPRRRADYHYDRRCPCYLCEGHPERAQARAFGHLPPSLDPPTETLAEKERRLVAEHFERQRQRSADPPITTSGHYGGEGWALGRARKEGWSLESQIRDLRERVEQLEGVINYPVNPPDLPMSTYGNPPGWFLDIAMERSRQEAKFLEQHLPDGTGPDVDVTTLDVETALQAAAAAKRFTDRAAVEGTLTWRDVLCEEVCEAFAEADPEKLRVELIQVAAVAVRWIQDLDRRMVAILESVDPEREWNPGWPPDGA